MKKIKEEVYTLDNVKVLIKKGYYRLYFIDKFYSRNKVIIHCKKCGDYRNLPNRIRTRPINMTKWLKLEEELPY